MLHISQYLSPFCPLFGGVLIFFLYMASLVAYPISLMIPYLLVGRVKWKHSTILDLVEICAILEMHVALLI